MNATRRHLAIAGTVAFTMLVARTASAQTSGSSSSPPPSSAAPLEATAATYPSEHESSAPPASAEALPAARDATSASHHGATYARISPDDGSIELHVGPVTITPRGYLETYYQYNFNQPSNGITNYRGFDNRHNTFTLSNAVLDVSASVAGVTLRIAGQVGSTPDSYYLAEPASRGTRVVSATGASAWKYLQQANIAWRAPVGRGLTLEAGLFLSPIGPETIPVHSNFNWSRSNLFFALPYYHVGARASYPTTEHTRVAVGVWNGWNNVVDNNPAKSLSASFEYQRERVSFNALYFGGVERNEGLAEGAPWRNLFDLIFAYQVHDRVELMAHLDAGFEPNRLGTAGWAAAALYARVRITSFLRVALRGDVFGEFVPRDRLATAIFWNGATWVSSGTATIDLHAFEHASLRLEYRFDACDPTHPLYFHHNVAATEPGEFVTNAATQNTLTLGLTAWF